MRQAPNSPDPTGAHPSTAPNPDAPGSPGTSMNASATSSGGLRPLFYPQWASGDPRASSAQSLVSSVADNPGTTRKRTLLVVYIHGFMGSGTSFRSFPAHVHNLLKLLLVETHVIHTKIYPRYKTYKSIEVARDNFSTWLAPHESHTTDIVLVGHSMGGVLAADVVLLPSQHPYGARFPYRHRILGVICLDAPLLGLHPGIVVSGIASLFRPAPSPPPADEDAPAPDGRLSPSQTLSPDPSIYSEVSPPSGASSPVLRPYPSTSSVDSSAPGPADPFFNPPFFNDVAFVDRGWYRNILHFVNKHKEKNLISAGARHVLSHLEFGACLADYPALRARYERLRKLEDTGNWTRPSSAEDQIRVRFANYYTVCTGISSDSTAEPLYGSPKGVEDGLDIGGHFTDAEVETAVADIPAESVQTATPRISIENCGDGESSESLLELEPIFEVDASEPLSSAQPAEDGSGTEPTGPAVVGDTARGDVTIRTLDLPSVPNLPPPPSTPDLDACPDKESRKQAKKAFKLAQKAHAQAVKARDKAIKAHRKALDKQRRQAEREQHQGKSRPAPGSAKLHKDQPPLAESSHHQSFTEPQELEETEDGAGRDQKQKLKQKQKKLPRFRKFCMLPPRAPDGRRDPAWVEVFMEGVDEVGAHCGLFLPGPHYERLVGDVGERIAGWVWDDASRQAVVEAASAGDGAGRDSIGGR